jgi:hypothetical protein
MSLAYFCMACNISRVHKRQENTSMHATQLVMIGYDTPIGYCRTLVEDPVMVRWPQRRHESGHFGMSRPE